MSALITTKEAAGFEATCMVCKRTVNPWPLERGDRCSPKDWASCIRPFDSPKVVITWL